MQRIHDNGYVYKGIYEGWYCPRCADFKTENEVGEDNTCPIHKIPLDREQRGELVLQALRLPGARSSSSTPTSRSSCAPRHRYNEALAFITGGLNDVSLSRSKLTWGVEVPWDPDHVFYVWFDALLNYYTALSFARDGEDLTDKFWPAFHIIGKDILKFHAVFWPAMLMAAGIELPREIFIHGYLLMKDASGAEHKMSKSLGNVLDPFEVMDRFGTDALRYYCFREVSFGQDGGVSTITFGERYETELANELGNLASRTTEHARPLPRRRGADGRRRPGAGAPTSTASSRRSRALLDEAEITQALERIWQRVRRLNRYVEENAPWQLAKDEAQGRRAAAPTLRSLAEGLRVVTVLLTPYIPESAEKLLDALGAPDIDARRARATARTRAGSRSRSSRRCSRSRSDRQPHPPRSRARARGRARRRRRARPASRASSRSGWTSRRARAALRGRRDLPGGLRARSAATPTRRPATTTRSPTSCASSPSTRTCRAIGETGLDDFRDYAPRADQERAFADQIALARELGKPLVIHTRAAEDDTIATLARDAAGPRGDPALLLDARPGSRSASTTAGGSRSPATSPTRRRTDLAEAAEQVAAGPPAGRDRRAVPDAAGRAQGAQPAGLRRPHRALHRRAPRHRLRRAGRGGRGQRCQALRLVSQPSAIRRMREFGIRPNRELGQNFLVDSNILDVIGRARRADRRRRRARGRRRARRAVRVPRRAHGARARRRARPRPRARAARRAGPAPEHDAAPRRRGQARPRRARPAARPRSSPTCPTASPRP